MYMYIFKLPIEKYMNNTAKVFGNINYYWNKTNHICVLKEICFILLI